MMLSEVTVFGIVIALTADSERHAVSTFMPLNFHLKSEEVQERNKATVEPVSIDSCRFCKGKNLKKYGIRRNKHTAIQRFSCSDCHKTFSMNLGFEKMKHNPKGITTAMQLYFSGESLRNVAKSLKLLSMDVSHQTIYN